MRDLHHERKIEIEETYKRREQSAYDYLKSCLKGITAAREFCLKVYRFIPDDWDVSFDDSGWVTIQANTNYDDGGNIIVRNPEEFRQVVRHVERIVGKKTERSVSGTSRIELRASVYGKEGTPYHGCYIRVNLYNPSCKVTWTEREVPAHTERTAIVPPECLGLERENGRETNA